MNTVQFFQGLLDWLLADPSHIVVAASVMAMVIPTPDPTTPWGKAFKVIDVLACNVLHAKEQGVPAALVAAVGQVVSASPPAAPVAQVASLGPAQTPPPSGPSGGAGTPVIRTLLAALLMSVVLSACSVPVAPKTPAGIVFDIRAGYDASVLGPAAAYNSLPRCPVADRSPCSDPEAIAQIRKADAAAAATLDAAEEVVRKHPDLDASAAITAARNAVTAAVKILAVYNIH